jgi:PAS domain S-box-containing protein
VVDGPRGSRLFTLHGPEEPYRILAERMNEGIATLNLQGTVLFCNRQLAEMLQVPAGRVVGSQFKSFLPNEGQLQWSQWISTAQQGSLRIEARLLRSDGAIVPVQLSLSEIPLDEQEPGICLVASDLTNQKAAQDQIRKFNEELEKRVALRTEQLRTVNDDLEAYNYGVAHDLRSPLRHIQGFADILLHEPESHLSPDGRRYLSLINKEASRMETLIQGLLGLSRVGRQTLQFQQTDFNTLVKDVIDTLSPDAGERQVEWRVTRMPVVRCDPVLMKIVFTNLLANALKFSRPRSPAVIEIETVDRDRTSVFRVRDNGVGFDMKYAEKLFGIFQRLHSSDQFEGTGVGLATVRRIIQKHGGRIWAEAELDKGASFSFTLGNSDIFQENTPTTMMGDKV